MPKLSLKEQARLAPDASYDQRRERVARLRDELNAQLDLICFSRESLQKSLTQSIDPYELSTSVEHLKKLAEMTRGFNSLTDARIRLLKAEKQSEDDMTPEQERNVVQDFVRGLAQKERSDFIETLVFQYRKDNPGYYKDWEPRDNSRKNPDE